MSFLLSDFNELNFDGLVAVNGGYNNSRAYSINCNSFIIFPPPTPHPIAEGYSINCSNTGSVYVNPGAGSAPVSYTPQNPQKQPTSYTTSIEAPKQIIIDVNRLKEAYY